MNLKVSIQIILKLMIIFLLILYLPTYSIQHVQVYKAISTSQTETSTPVATTTSVTSSHRIHIYNTHQSEEYNGYNVRLGAAYLKE